MMTIAVTFEENNLIVIRVDGLLTLHDWEGARHEVFTYLRQHGKSYCLILIDQAFANLQAFAKWQDTDEDFYIQKHLIRMALVGDIRWREAALLFLLNGLVPFQIEYFNPDQEYFARAWLTTKM